MLLLPPSEGKAEGGNRRRSTWTPESGSFGTALGDRRLEVVEALAAVHGGDERLLGVKGDHLRRAQSANTTLIGAPVLPAWQRYTGVVWDHLDPATLPAAAWKQVVVVSGLLGLVRGDDPAPDYRLKMGASVPPLGKLSTWWRPAISAEVSRLARRRVVVDLLPQEHRGALTHDGLHGVSITLVDPSGTPGGHFAKAAKGELARAILTDGLAALDTWHHPRFELSVTEFVGGSRGTPPRQPGR
ncbi:MAG TPA: peroxide stress protein YaaA [Ilumatobacteraceae bacterium]|nr:peroxide stress protein YaaA [Ilumatobacteraceae bacterium]